MMIKRITRAGMWGGGLAALYWLADLAGTFAAVGWLFDNTLGGWLLLAVAAGVTVAGGAIAGVLVALSWPRRLRLCLRSRWRALAAAVAAITIAVVGALARMDRNLAEPGPRPPVSASNPIPVLWVVIDTLRADSLYGVERDFPMAPSLRALSSSSLTFADAECSAGWTIPATATLLTGIHNTTMDASAGYLADWAPTLAERLRAAGYATHAVVDNVILEPRNGFAAGFETFFQRSAYRFAFSLPTFRMLPTWLREGLRAAFPVSYFGAPGAVDAAIDVIEEERDAPLFLYVHTMDPHAPYYPHPEQGPEPEDGADMVFWRARDRLRTDRGPMPTAAQMSLVKHRYAGEVAHGDRELGRLIHAWHARFGDRGLVLVTADHGEEFLEHGHLSHSLTVHREVIHVPLLVQLPSGAVPAEHATGVVDDPVSHIDLVPTTLDLVGVDPKALDGPALHGHSWLPWLRGEAAAPSRPIMGSHSRHGRRIYRYREGPWVFIRTAYYDGRPTEYGLYDVRADPFEQDNRYRHLADLAPGIDGRCDELAIALRAAYDPKRPNESKADEDALRAMGYIQ